MRCGGAASATQGARSWIWAAKSRDVVTSRAPWPPDAAALDQRLDALAATVCAHDPRTREQRRADALGALAAGADRLGCRCARRDCAAGQRRPAGPVVIHVIADQIARPGRRFGTGQLDADGLISPELLAELAKTAKLSR